MAKKEPKNLTVAPMGAWPIVIGHKGICGQEEQGGLTLQPTTAWSNRHNTSFSWVLTREDTRRLAAHLNDLVEWWDETDGRVRITPVEAKKKGMVKR